MFEFCAKMKKHAQKILNPLAQCVLKTEQIDSFQGLHLGTGLLQPDMLLISNDRWFQGQDSFHTVNQIE